MMVKKAEASPAQLSITWAPDAPAPAVAEASITAPPATSAADLIATYIAWLHVRDLAPKYVLAVDVALRQLEAAAGHPLVAVTAADLDRFMALLAGRELAAGTVARYQIIYRCFFRWAADQEDVTLAERSPTRRLVAPKGESRIRPYLMPDQADQLLAALPSGSRSAARDTAITTLLYYTGMRCGELVGLDVDSLRRSERTIRVFGKGRRERDIPGPAALWRWLDAWMAYHPGSGALLVDVAGRRMNASQVRRSLARVLGLAGLEALGIGPHGLRHTYASRLAAAGMRLTDIQRLLGHASVTTTERYVHGVLSDDARRFLDESL